MILGAGIYSLIGKSAGLAGDSLWLSVLLASAASFLTALSYAELAGMFPKVGGEYVYLKAAFPGSPWVATAGSLIMAFADTAVAATVALAFAGYLRVFLEVPPHLCAFLLLALFTGVNLSGIRQSTWMNVVFTLIEVFGLVLFIYFGVRAESFGDALGAAPSTATVSGSALIIFAFFGFDDIVNFAEETHDPKSDIPKAIVLSMTIATILYVLVALAAVSLLPAQDLARSDAPFADALRQHSPIAAGSIGWIALFSTANTVLISLLTTSRIYFGMARDGALPRVLSRLSRSRQTPWVSTLLTFVLASLLLTAGNLERLGSISSFAALCAFILVNIAAIVLRFREPDAHRPFRVRPGFRRVPIPPVLGALACFYLMIYLSW